MAETTLVTLAGAVKRQYGYYAQGTVQSGSASSIADTLGLIEANDVWVNHFVRMMTGNAAGQERLVTAYTQGALVFEPALSQAVAPGDGYEISPLRQADVLGAITDAVNASGGAWMRVVVDDTLEADTEVALPAACVAVLDVLLDGKPTQWGLAGQPGAMSLVLAEGASGTLRVQYLALANRLTEGTDTDTLGMGEGEREALAFVKEYALHLLHEQALARDLTGEAQRVHNTLMQSHLNKALTIEAKRERRGWNKAQSHMARKALPVQD